MRMAVGLIGTTGGIALLAAALVILRNPNGMGVRMARRVVPCYYDLAFVEAKRPLVALVTGAIGAIWLSVGIALLAH